MAVSQEHPEGSSLVSPLKYRLRPSSSFPTGHVVPEATLGGPIALVKDGDRIIIDSASRTIDWLVEEDEKAARKKEWEASGKSALKERRGILYRYARDVAVSDTREVCDLWVPDLVHSAC
jgi:dihydroxy-acid dehydratase